MTQQSEPNVFFVLGGPGSGKGTVCSSLVEVFGLTHFSTGDLLREAAKSGASAVAKKISDIIQSGNIVPSEITVELLSEAIRNQPNPRGYLVDGFPRKMDQAIMFEMSIAHPKGILYFDCSESTMEERLLNRSKEGTGRTDDNPETIRNRFRVNMEQCMPVVEHYRSNNRLHAIDANRSREEVCADAKNVMIKLGVVPVDS